MDKGDTKAQATHQPLGRSVLQGPIRVRQGDLDVLLQAPCDLRLRESLPGMPLEAGRQVFHERVHETLAALPSEVMHVVPMTAWHGLLVGYESLDWFSSLTLPGGFLRS
jgi:hypothetical protein